MEQLCHRTAKWTKDFSKFRDYLSKMKCVLQSRHLRRPRSPRCHRKQQLLLFSILCFSTCQVLIDWLQWISAAVLLQSAGARRINTLYVRVGACRPKIGWGSTACRLICSSPTSSFPTSSASNHPSRTSPWPRWFRS